jgi:hypothetical protein
MGRFGWSAAIVFGASLLLGSMWDVSESFTAPAAAFTLEGPFTHENLAVYFVHGSASDARQYITLDEGLAARTVKVREKGTRAGQDRAEVNTLEIENASDSWLFLQAGDIVKGGKQDRAIMTDLTLAPHSGPQPLDAFCVEHGRWAPGRDGLTFMQTPGMVAGTSLKVAIQGEKNQSRVWQEVAKAESRAVTVARAAGDSIAAEARLSSTGTYNAIADNKTVSGNRDAYVTALLPHVRKQNKAIGLAIAINGTVTSADVYASPVLFQRLVGKLLNSYALEALLARDARPRASTPTKQRVTAFLSRPAAARESAETIGGSMHRVTRETDETVMYEYGHLREKRAVMVHQSYLKK